MMDKDQSVNPLKVSQSPHPFEHCLHWSQSSTRAPGTKPKAMSGEEDAFAIASDTRCSVASVNPKSARSLESTPLQVPLPVPVQSQDSAQTWILLSFNNGCTLVLLTFPRSKTYSLLQPSPQAA